MEYPDAKFIKSYRQAMFISFVTLFFVISPITIMYSMGYRYNWRDGLLKETGSLSIDVEPKTARVYLDDKRITQKMPVRLNNVAAPQNYQLRLSALGYFDWAKDIDIRNKQTVYIKEISLLRKEKPEMLLTGDVTNASVSPANNYLAFIVRKDGRMEVWLTQIGQWSPIMAGSIPNIQRVDIVWAKRYPYFVVADELQPHKQIMFVNAERPDATIDIGELKKNILKYQWGLSGDPEFIYSVGETIFSFTPSNQSHRVITKNRFLDWFMGEDGLWVLNVNTTTKQLTLMKDSLGFQNEFQQFDSTDNTQNARNKWRILTVNNEVALLKQTNAPKMLILTNDKQFEVAGEHLLISPYHDWWLIWTPWELWSYVKGEEPYLLNRSGEQLQTVLPLDKYNTLGLVWANKTTVLYPYYAVAHDLVKEKIISAGADSENRTVYFSAEIEGENGLWKLDY